MTAAQDTLPRRFWQWARERAATTMLRQKELGVWQPCSWQQASDVVGDLAAGLVTLGVQPGEAVGILANTSKQWVFADLGTQTAGAVVCGLHPSESGPQVQASCKDAGVRVLFVENEEQLDKVLDGGAWAGLQHIVAFRMEGLRHLDDPRLSSLDELLRRGGEVRAADAGLIEKCLASRTAGDVATLVFTSGTTGRPKAVMLSHANILAACEATRSALFANAAAGGERVLFLPLSHVMERIGGEYLSMQIGAVMNFVENPETVFEDLREIQPDVFMAVPRVWERMYSTLVFALHEATTLQQWAYARAIGAGRRLADAAERGETPSLGLRLGYRFARLLVLDNLRRMMGLDRVRLGVTGAAPIAPDLIRWYRAMGIDLREVWGLSEVSGGATVSGAGGVPGSVGKPMAPVQVRVSGEGEILVRGPTVFAGYHGEPHDSALHADGWLRTGDMGRVDEEGRLYITDRLENIIVAPSGARIAPSEWENRLKFSPYISDAIVVGDGRPNLACLVMIDQEIVEQWAQDRQVGFSDFRSLCASREVIALVAQEIEQLNRRTGGGARIEAFRLIDAPGGADDDELTPTMKLKRGRVVEKYAELIEAMYAGQAA